MGNFVHFHTHSEYSVLDSINKIETLPSHIKKLGQDALAITDHGSLGGVYKFYKACKKAGVKPILGMEAYYTPLDRSVRDIDDLERPYHHLILIALNNTGLHNLFKLSSYAYTEGMYHRPRIDDDLLGRYSEGICATTSCLGARFAQLILADRVKDAEKLIHHHRAIFQDRFLVELQLHTNEEQQKVNKVLLEIAKKENLPIIITNDCHYTHEEDKVFHEITLCMRTKSFLSDEKRFTFGEIDVHTANHDWMWERAEAQGIPYEGISNTLALADMVDSESYFSDIMNRYPKFKGIPDGMQSWEHLEREAKKGLFEKMRGMPPQDYKDRLDYELKVIKKMGFSDYMLIVQELMQGGRGEGILYGPGRGSSAGSLTAYALGITEVDPLPYGLIFQRFLNIGRSAQPLIFTPEMKQEISNV